MNEVDFLRVWVAFFGVAFVWSIICALMQRSEARSIKRLWVEQGVTLERVTHQLIDTKKLEKEWYDKYHEAISDMMRAKRGNIYEIGKAHARWLTSVGWGNETLMEALAMISSEITEAKQESDDDPLVMDALYRVEQACARAVNIARSGAQHKVCAKPEFAAELADIILRVAGLAQTRGVNLVTAIEEKMTKNAKGGNKGRVL